MDEGVGDGDTYFDAVLANTSKLSSKCCWSLLWPEGQ